MEDLSLFLKENKIKRENQKYAPTKSILDKNGVPVEWEFRPLSSEEVDEIRMDNTMEVQVTGKPGQYRQKSDTKKIIRQMIAASVVYPDLYDVELQDSYGVRTPEELVPAIVDTPGEYDDLSVFIQKMNGFMPLDNKVEQAKN